MSASNNSGRGPFATALRDLAKQADIKDDGTVEQKPVSATTSNNNPPNNAHLHQRSGSATENRTIESTPSDPKKLNTPPPEKVFILIQENLKYFILQSKFFIIKFRWHE